MAPPVLLKDLNAELKKFADEMRWNNKHSHEGSNESFKYAT